LDFIREDFQFTNMPYSTKHQKQSRKACKTKAIRNSKYTKRRKNQQQREAAKVTLKLHTFWEVKKPDEEIDKEVADEDNIEVDNDINEDSDDKVNEHLDDEVKDYNWHNKIPDALKNLKLDIKKEKVNSEV
ncbi:16839_t:CDS:2, partial [Funneliformis caledonium]